MSSPIPLITESSTAESVHVESTMNDLRDGMLEIPAYQRDADQWDDSMKSLFIESIINNITVPAFFFEPKFREGIEYNEVVDGQQRLTTLQSFWKDEFTLVDAESAPYLTPNSVHYAAKRFSQLPTPYQQAFKRYRLTIIKLRNLGDTRLEVFRRINQGGTPLSGQDIRLAYYGDSKSLALLRLVGLYDEHSPTTSRMLDWAKTYYPELASFMWSEGAAETWYDWWSGKRISRGQTSSEMFLWSLVSAYHDELADVLAHSGLLKDIGVQFQATIDEALDVFVATMRYQDLHPEFPPKLVDYDTLAGRFADHFQLWFQLIAGQHGVNLPVTKYRLIASVIGIAFKFNIEHTSLTEKQWGTLIEMVRRPRDYSFPESKGRWIGPRGYQAHFRAVEKAMSKICGIT